MIGRRRRGIAPADLLAEAAAGIAQRPARAALTAVGTVLGVGAFVATLGIATTASSQVSERFDLLRATQVSVLAQPDASDARPFPPDAEARVRRLNGVVAAGEMWSVKLPEAVVRPSWVATAAQEVELDVVAASPGLFAATRARVASGRRFDAFHADRAEPVAVLGAGAARELRLAPVEHQPAVLVGDVPLTVIGVVDDVERHPELLRSVIVPASTARRAWGDAAVEGVMRLVIDTRLGAAELIGRQAPLALRPDRPDALQAEVPPDPRGLRSAVEADVNDLVLGLAALSLLIGAIGIANTTLVSVMERVREIGLRRALGASRAAIGAQVLAESAVLGSLGGVVGAALGVLTTTLVAASQGWSAVIDPLYLAPAPVMGTVTGLVAGLYPALKAAAVAPLQALRG